MFIRGGVLHSIASVMELAVEDQAIEALHKNYLMPDLHAHELAGVLWKG